MTSYRIGACRHLARIGSFFTTLLLALIAAGFSYSPAASAALIGVSVSYDGSVKVGTTTGVEEHDLAPIFPPDPAVLPVTNPPLTAPLQPARPLSGNFDEFLDSFMSMIVQHVVITLQATNPALTTFTNPIDTALPFPVQFDGQFYSNSLGANQMLVLAGVGIEDGNDLPPNFPVPGSITVSGVGTQANPWRVQLGIQASLVNVNNGFAKVHLYYKTGPLVIPEPTSLALIAIGLATAFGYGSRRRAG